MTGITKRAGSKVAALLTEGGRLAAAVSNLARAEGVIAAAIDPKGIFLHNVSADVAERALELRYPTLAVYCEKAANQLREKFRVFSGRLSMVAELRTTQDRLEGLEATTQLYADALMQVLDRSRGDWGDGMYYAGAYDVEFGAVKRGGRGFLQAARVRFEIDVTR